jgi:hypothetical protein
MIRAASRLAGDLGAIVVKRRQPLTLVSEEGTEFSSITI